MVARFYMRITPKSLVLAAVTLSLLLCVYYAHNTYNVDDGVVSRSEALKEDVEEISNNETRDAEEQRNINNNVVAEEGNEIKERPDNKIETTTTKKPRKNVVEESSCPNLYSSEADVNTVDVFKDFEFQPTWMRSKEYWDKSFEDRYEKQKMDTERPPLKVIIVPHSHNDPGWLKTFENYFHSQSKQILNHMVAKMQQYQNLTFIWSEISFLNAWWETAHPIKQSALKSLAHSGRLEITTGGWVMTDEANSHVYAMVDQLIEGNYIFFLKSVFGIIE
nr:alpha-mannosidase 2-like [Onthophagus taurus]